MRARNWQDDIEDFHKEVLDGHVGESPQIRRPELRARLIMEEAAETASAITGESVEYRIGMDQPEHLDAPPSESLAEAIDGMVDTIVVVCGTAIEFGIDLQPFWEEVHRTNMAKKDGPVREDGKKLKPEGWEPPDIAGLLERLYGVES